MNLNNENYIEQLKRLNVYDELLALKKLPTTKINNLTNEKPKGSDTEQQIAEKMADIKKSKIFLIFGNFQNFYDFWKFY